MLTSTVIIVNYNGKHLLEDCLEGLQAQTRAPDEVIVVDNGSSDDSVLYLSRSYPWVRVIETGENLGFSTGNNRGIRASSGDIVILLNNDTFPSPGFIDEILGPLEASVEWSAVSGVMLFSSDVNQVATSGIAVYRTGLALDRDTGITWRQLSHRSEVFGPTGGVAAIRRSALEDVDLFPEPFFMYLEDVDLAWRLRLRAHRTVSVAGAWTLHVYSASSSQGSSFKDYHLARNRAWSLIRCWPADLWRRYWATVLWYEISAIAFALMTGRWASIRGRIAGWAGVLRLMKVRRKVQSRATVTGGELLYWLCPAPSARNVLQLRRVINKATRGGDTEHPDESQRHRH